MMDSSTRLLGPREIGLAIGEPPARQGYPPSVFFQILTDGANRNSETGSITASYHLHIKDMEAHRRRSPRYSGWHIILNRELGARNYWPAIDILPSLSQVANGIVADGHKGAAAKFERS